MSTQYGPPTLPMPGGHPEESSGAAGGTGASLRGSSRLVACLDVAPTPLLRFFHFGWARDFEGGRLARRDFFSRPPGAGLRSRPRPGRAEDVSSAREGTSPSTGVASALVHKTSEAAI